MCGAPISRCLLVKIGPVNLNILAGKRSFIKSLHASAKSDIDCSSALCSCLLMAKAMAKDSTLAIEEVHRERLVAVFKY